jgi:hypothetical protein
MFKKTSMRLCTSNAVVSPDTSSPTASTTSSIKSPELTEEDPDDPKPPDGGDIQMEYSSD